MRNCGCNEFSRSSLLRKAVAQAGEGLPAIEPGMPLPAGTGLDRRSFLARSVGFAVAVYGATALSPRAFDHGIAQALAAGPPDTVLVSIFLDGGADSLSVLFPHGDPEYRRLRPKLALPDSGLVFPEDARLRWHPSAQAFHTLHSEGKLSVLPAIGYTNADQSHFTSRHYWEVGNTDPRLQTGWLGRYLDHVGSADNPLQGVSLDGNLPPRSPPPGSRSRPSAARATTRSGRRASTARSRSGCSMRSARSARPAGTTPRCARRAR